MRFRARITVGLAGVVGLAALLAPIFTWRVRPEAWRASMGLGEPSSRGGPPEPLRPGTPRAPLFFEDQAIPACGDVNHGCIRRCEGTEGPCVDHGGKFGLTFACLRGPMGSEQPICTKWGVRPRCGCSSRAMSRYDGKIYDCWSCQLYVPFDEPAEEKP